MSTPEVIVFDNLVAANSGPIGGERKVQIKPENFVAANAKGGLRNINSFEEVGPMAEKTAAGFLKAFSTKK